MARSRAVRASIFSSSALRASSVPLANEARRRSEITRSTESSPLATLWMASRIGVFPDNAERAAPDSRFVRATVAYAREHEDPRTRRLDQCVDGLAAVLVSEVQVENDNVNLCLREEAQRSLRVRGLADHAHAR